MGLYKLFSYNAEIQYKSCLLSKATLFTLITTALNLVLPFVIANRSRGFWLRSHSFYEQPKVHFPYEFILVAETQDPSTPIICNSGVHFDNYFDTGEENCAEIQVQEQDTNGDYRNDLLKFGFHLSIPSDRTISSVLLLLSLDFKLQTVCPLHMQSLAVFNYVFGLPTSGIKYYGNLELNQITHLPCLWNHIDIKYNQSLLLNAMTNNGNLVDNIMENYFERQVTTQVNVIHSRVQSGHTGRMDISVTLRVPEIKVQYIPSLLQELKWAWPQYLSLVIIFYWIFDRIKRFVFHKRLLMAWEVVPWNKKKI